MHPPTAGRIVWYYYNEQLDHCAAIVNVDAKRDGRASLTAFTPGRGVRGPEMLPTTIPQCDVFAPRWGFWSWMPYQMAKAKTAEGNESESAEPHRFYGEPKQSEPEPSIDAPKQGETDDGTIAAETGQRPEEEEESEVAASEVAGSGDEGEAPAGASGTVEG